MQFLGGVSKINVSIFQVRGTIYFAECHMCMESYKKEHYKILDTLYV